MLRNWRNQRQSKNIALATVRLEPHSEAIVREALQCRGEKRGRRMGADLGCQLPMRTTDKTAILLNDGILTVLRPFLGHPEQLLPTIHFSPDLGSSNPELAPQDS